jgi:hypothetical protein
MARISAGERLLANVATEVVGFELGRSSSGDEAATAELRSFLSALPGAGLPSLGGLDVVLLARATLAVKDGEWATAVGIQRRGRPGASRRSRANARCSCRCGSAQVWVARARVRLALECDPFVVRLGMQDCMSEC